MSARRRLGVSETVRGINQYEHRPPAPTLQDGWSLTATGAKSKYWLDSSQKRASLADVLAQIGGKKVQRMFKVFAGLVVSEA